MVTLGACLCIALGVLGCLLFVTHHAEGGLAPGAPAAADVRVIHLSLSGTDRKVRFGLRGDASWEDFQRGVQARLELKVAPLRIETNDGMLIRSVVDLQHRDSLVVYDSPPQETAAIELWGVADVISFFDELGLGQYKPMLEQHALDGAMLLEIAKDDEAMGELGVTSKLHLGKVRSRLKSVRR